MQPSRRGDHCRRESVLDQHRQRFFDQVGVAVIECEHDRARRKRLCHSATLAEFAERQPGKPLAPKIIKLCAERGGANGKCARRGGRSVAHGVIHQDRQGGVYLFGIHQPPPLPRWLICRIEPTRYPSAVDIRPTTIAAARSSAAQSPRAARRRPRSTPAGSVTAVYLPSVLRPARNPTLVVTKAFDSPSAKQRETKYENLARD